MPARILLTGFEPFGPHPVNPSEVLVRRLAEAPPAGVRLTTRVLPVAWRRAFGPVRTALLGGRFDAVLLVGLAGNRRDLEFERFALNWRASPDPDEDGESDDGSPIDPSGPAACLATLPVGDLVDAAKAAGAPARTSNHAGTFLCNQVLYQTLRLADRADLRCRVGFLHVPPFAEPFAEPGAASPADGLSEDVQARALAAVLRRMAAGAEATAPRPRDERGPSRVQRKRRAGGGVRRGSRSPQGNARGRTSGDARKSGSPGRRRSAGPSVSRTRGGER